jgi:hypothetical protein
MKAELRDEVAHLTSQYLAKEADAELGQSNNLENLRKHQQRMKHTVNMIRITKNSNIVMAGETGEGMLDFFKDTNDLVFNEKL